MTKSERSELTEIKQILEGAFKDRYEPENGWKTARAVFENNTVNALKNIQEKLEQINTTGTKQVPALINSINDIQCWRKRMNKVLIWIGMGVGSPILGGIGYLIFKSIAK